MKVFSLHAHKGSFCLWRSSQMLIFFPYSGPSCVSCADPEIIWGDPDNGLLGLLSHQNISQAPRDCPREAIGRGPIAPRGWSLPEFLTWLNVQTPCPTAFWILHAQCVQSERAKLDFLCFSHWLFIIDLSKLCPRCKLYNKFLQTFPTYPRCCS